MDTIEDVLNRIGDFHIEADKRSILLTGNLQKQNDIIVLEARVMQDDVKLIQEIEICQIWGIVGTIKVTLLNSLIHIGFLFGSGESFNTLVAEPTEIVIGRCYTGEAKITRISASISALNYMFSERLFEENIDFSKEKPALLNFAYPNPICAKDKDGELSLARGFQHSTSREKIEYKILPYMEYKFSAPTTVREAIAKIASVRNLFSFFADYYIPLENLTFADMETAKIENFPDLCDCKLYMNWKDDIDVPPKPFLISTKDFCNHFTQIWGKWSQFYNENRYIPTLFYEIICNRSTRINCFLNLSQAIEIYSNYYREKDAYSIAKADGYKKKSIPLKYRVEDMIQYLNPYLAIDSSNIKPLAKAISNARNFFTHYNKKRYNEPSFQEISAANRILRYMLLAIIYKTIGLSDDCIKKSGETALYSLRKRDIEVVLRKRNDIEYTSWFD
jgi:hypothetical protein